MSKRCGLDSGIGTPEASTVANWNNAGSYALELGSTGFYAAIENGTFVPPVFVPLSPFIPMIPPPIHINVPHFHNWLPESYMNVPHPSMNAVPQLPDTSVPPPNIYFPPPTDLSVPPPNYIVPRFSLSLKLCNCPGRSVKIRKAVDLDAVYLGLCRPEEKKLFKKTGTVESRLKS